MGHKLKYIRLSFCLSISTGLGRMLILENEDAPIYKFNASWNELFKPIAKCSYTEHVSHYCTYFKTLKSESHNLTLPGTLILLVLVLRTSKN